MDVKTPTTGLRIATYNFERKLYADTKHMEDALQNMQHMGINILVCTEPGQASLFNTTRITNVARSAGYNVKYSYRDRTQPHGGIVIITDPAWSKIPCQTKMYEPPSKHLRGRMMSITFDNKTQGEHNKLQIIAAHLLNSAHTKHTETAGLLGWACARTTEFHSKYPKASTIMMGDLNAAGDTYLDTDRTSDRTTEGTNEPDAFVLENIGHMKLRDVLRHRYPKERVVTRAVQHQTNRYLDRIYTSKQIANHESTRIGVQKGDFAMAGSDHKLIVADLPIDTAACAQSRTSIWRPHKFDTWTLPDRTPEEEREATEEFNAALAASKGNTTDDLEWITNAARTTLLELKTRTYPTIPNPKKHYSTHDWKQHKNLHTLRSLRVQILSHRIEHQTDLPKAIITKARKQILTLQSIAKTPVTQQKYDTLWEQLRKGQEQAGLDLLNQMVEALEKHLDNKERYSRATQIRNNIKRRAQRFKSPDKTMLKLVINSIMQRYREQQHITSAQTPDGLACSEQEVAKAIVAFFSEWMASRVHVSERWGSWQNMMDMDTECIQDQAHKDFVETAYMRSFRYYDELQQNEGIWDEVMQAAPMEEIQTALKKFKSHTAPGPSGITVQILKFMSDENMDRVRLTINRHIAGEPIPATWNMSLLRPLPKTDAGLSDLAKTRPIALMETILKLMERILFTRITTVTEKHKMLREEQYGGLPNRMIQDPIRILAELLEDAHTKGTELHVFSADLSKAFDTLEYWSQAMSWRALGAPKEMVTLLVDMDRGGKTAVVIAPGQTTATILGPDQGTFASARGVRQGSVGGPMKWIVFMHFWLDYLHTTRKGAGYSMDSQAPEIIGQMMIDDSNWFATTSEDMTDTIARCHEFITYHGLSFNKGKCEYLVLNQQQTHQGEDEFNLPTWPSGEQVEPKSRKVEDPTRWERDRKLVQEELTKLGHVALNLGDLVTEQPTQEERHHVQVIIEKWRQDLVKHAQQRDLRGTVETALNTAKRKIFGDSRWEDITLHTAEWMEQWEQWSALQKQYIIHEDESTRYLGVFFNTNMSWRAQQAVLEQKFETLHTRISATSPTIEMAIYIINAVIISALKFPLQVAYIPKTTLRRWDSRLRAVVKRAGYLPTNTAPELLHLPKKLGGKGLLSLETEAKVARVVTQMRYLTTDTKAGQVVQAAYRRASRSRESHTIQAHTAAALTDLQAVIQGHSKPEVENLEEQLYMTADQATQEDILNACAADRRHNTIHAFGDGATWDTEGITAWGLHLEEGHGGETIARTSGRTPGSQRNDASEAYAILQALIQVHPEDPVKIYCDNQGCVDFWEGGGTTNKHFRAIWNRILGMKKHRKEQGADTTLVWLQSHVQDSNKRTNNKSNRTCACRTAHNMDSCAQPGQPTGWMHGGNDTADELAKEAKTQPLDQTIWARAQGEAPYILTNTSGTDLAQGCYRAWTQDQARKIMMQTHPSKQLERLLQAKDKAHGALWATLLKTLDTPGSTSWRRWHRTLTGNLPTNSMLAKREHATPDNIYKTVYQGTLGLKGRCVRCQAEKESTHHAIWECPRAQPEWGRLNAKLTLLWAEHNQEWNRHSWIDSPPSGWSPLWTASGLVPKDNIKTLEPLSPAIHNLLAKSSALCMQVAGTIWDSRNTENEAWIAADPALAARKKQANMTNWGRGAERQPRQLATTTSTNLKRNRLQTILLERKEKRKATEDAAREEELARQAKRNQGREAARALTKGHLEVAELVEAVAHKASKRTLDSFKPIIKRAKMAGNTPDIDMTTLAPVSMHDSTPKLSSKIRNKGSYYWVPKKHQRVTVLWTHPKGTSKHYNLTGEWHSGTVTNLEWPDSQGTPGAWVAYDDGVVEWHPMDMCGDTLLPLTPPATKPGLLYDEVFPKGVTDWLGFGARLQVKTGGAWYVGQVIGREGNGVMVQYRDSIDVHSDLHTRGCRIRSFKPKIDIEALYAREPWRQCPYGGGDEACTCPRCTHSKWPERYAQWELTLEQIKQLESIKPVDRNNYYNNGRHLPAESPRGGNPRRKRPAETREEAGGQVLGHPRTRARVQRLGETQDSPSAAQSGQGVGSSGSAGGTGHVNHDASPSASGPGSLAGARPRRVGPTAAGARPSGRHDRDGGLSEGMAGGKRGAPAESLYDPSETGEADATEECEEENGTQQGGPNGHHGSNGYPECTRSRCTQELPQPDAEQGGVDYLDSGCNPMDGPPPVALKRRGNRKRKEGSGSTLAPGNPTPDPQGTEPGGGVEIGRNQTGGTHGGQRTGDRSGQKRPHLDGVAGGDHNIGDKSRLVGPEDGPADSPVKESVNQRGELGVGHPGTGVHVVQCCQRAQPDDRGSTWQVVADSTQQKERSSRQTATGAASVRGGDWSDKDSTGHAGGAPGSPLLPRESGGLRTVGAGHHGGSDQQEPYVAAGADRQMRLRPRRAKAHLHPHKYITLATQGHDREREVPRREVHRSEDAVRQDKAPETDDAYDDGRRPGQGPEERRPVPVDKGSRKKRSRETAAAGNHVSAAKPPPPGPRKGSPKHRRSSAVNEPSPEKTVTRKRRSISPGSGTEASDQRSAKRPRKPGDWLTASHLTSGTVTVPGS
jgi:ribonuclease HI